MAQLHRRRSFRVDPAAPDRWQALDERERRSYDDARIAHHAELVVVTTSAIQEITTEGQMLVLLNQREIGARRGLIVSGDAATGKTTAIKQLGKLPPHLTVCRRHRLWIGPTAGTVPHLEWHRTRDR